VEQRADDFRALRPYHWRSAGRPALLHGWVDGGRTYRGPARSEAYAWSGSPTQVRSRKEASLCSPSGTDAGRATTGMGREEADWDSMTDFERRLRPELDPGEEPR